MVDKILDEPIDHITMREPLGLSLDLLSEIWEVRRLPLLNKVAIPSMQAEDIRTETMAASTEATAGAANTHSQERAHTCGLSRERQSSGVLQELYACASPTVVGKVEGKLRVKMLIDSGSEMNVMSKGLWERAQDLLSIDIDISWSIGSANSTHDRVYSICHTVAVDIGEVEIMVPVFVLEGTSEQFILVRPWEWLMRAQYNN